MMKSVNQKFILLRRLQYLSKDYFYNMTLRSIILSQLLTIIKTLKKTILGTYLPINYHYYKYIMIIDSLIILQNNK